MEQKTRLSGRVAARITSPSFPEHLASQSTMTECCASYRRPLTAHCNRARVKRAPAERHSHIPAHEYDLPCATFLHQHMRRAGIAKRQPATDRQ
jgi:hypothetical protein